MERYGVGKTRRSAVLASFQNYLVNHILTWTISSQIFAQLRWHRLWVQNGVVCVAICAHLNKLQICFVFIQQDMHAGAAVEPWDSCFHIGISCLYGSNLYSYLATGVSQRAWNFAGRYIQARYMYVWSFMKFYQELDNVYHNCFLCGCAQAYN